VVDVGELELSGEFQGFSLAAVSLTGIKIPPEREMSRNIRCRRREVGRSR
jgi:hypothetical protein